jgi:hypothetical protein
LVKLWYHQALCGKCHGSLPPSSNWIIGIINTSKNNLVVRLLECTQKSRILGLDERKTSKYLSCLCFSKLTQHSPTNRCHFAMPTQACIQDGVQQLDNWGDQITNWKW